MQNERQQLLITSNNRIIYIPIHSLWHAVEVLPQPSCVTPSCKLAIAMLLELMRLVYLWLYISDDTNDNSLLLVSCLLQLVLVRVAFTN